MVPPHNDQFCPTMLLRMRPLGVPSAGGTKVTVRTPCSCLNVSMAIQAQYSYFYRLRWGATATVVCAGDYGVGPVPEVGVEGRTLVLSRAAREVCPGGYSCLRFDLSWIADLRAGDDLALTRVPGVGHEAITLWRGGELLLHVGHLPCLSESWVRLTNDFDVSGCLKIESEGQTHLLGPGGTLRLQNYQCHLLRLTGSCLGPGYCSDGWLAVDGFAECARRWAGKEFGWTESVTARPNFWQAFVRRLTVPIGLSRR